MISKEEHMKQINKIKELYKELPKKKEELFDYTLDWDSLLKYEIINKTCRPWIAKKINEYMGAEEQSMIQLVLKLLNQKCTHK